MKTRKIKGGYIEKIDDKWTITSPTGNSTVNEYRRLELIELDKLASLSKSSNSNEALKETVIEDKYDEMCDSNTKPTDDIEDTKKNIRSIINLRNQENIRMFKYNETLEEKRIRIGHEHRLKLWRKKYKIIREIYFNHYGENTTDELTFLSSDEFTLLEKKKYLNEQLDIINTNKSVIDALFKELKDLSNDFNVAVTDRIYEILHQLRIDPSKGEMSEWIKPFVEEKEVEVEAEQMERKRDLEQLMEEVESQLNEVADDIITTPSKTPQKPSRELEGNNLLLGAEELTPVKTKEVKKNKRRRRTNSLRRRTFIIRKRKERTNSIGFI